MTREAESRDVARAALVMAITENREEEAQQKAAFAHLKLKWDRVQGSGLYGRS